MCIENNYSNGRHKGGSSTRWGGSLLCRSKSNTGMKILPIYGQSKSAARVAMEVSSDIGAWGRCHPRPSFFGGTDQIPAKKINKSTSTINKFDLGHKNHKSRQICKKHQQINRQIWFSGTQIWNLSTCRQISNLLICRFFKKIHRSTDQQSTNLVFWDTLVYSFLCMPFRLWVRAKKVE